jgi:phosphatidylinositol kinase/protein kinase (PI-3  family)
MLGLHRKLPFPEVIDFRFTINVRRGLGIFEEQGNFLFICDLALKALFKHYDNIETRLMTFVMDPITINEDM